jgi:hydroxymethylglutaryl-CoA synthase
MSAGIVGYGVYIPRFRIKRDEYLKVWGSFSARDVEEKAVPGLDEDAVTMAVESSANALKRAGIAANSLSGIFFASTSSPYSEKMSSSTIVAALDGPSETFLADIGFSTKAGTTAMLSCLDFVASKRADMGLAVASDAPQATPTDPFEHGFGAGSASFVIGKDDAIATVEGTHSSSLEIIGERYRRDGYRYVRDSAISGYKEQAFNQALSTSVTGLLKKIGIKPEEFGHVIFQQFDGRSPYDIGKRLGFVDKQISNSMTVTKIGDAGCASALIGLCAALDVARREERILVASYGAGAGSDSMSLVTTERIGERRNHAPSVQNYLEKKEYVDYITYLKFKRMLGVKQ